MINKLHRNSFLVLFCFLIWELFCLSLIEFKVSRTLNFVPVFELFCYGFCVKSLKYSFPQGRQQGKYWKRTHGFSSEKN